MEEGLGLDVCSGNELAVALSVGFPPERIGVHGNNKSIEELISAIEAGVGSIIVDSFDEIAKIETLAAQRECIVRVLVRVTTGVEAHTHEYIATSLEDGKFGFSVTTGQALEALMVCENSPHIHLGGIHSHIGSQIFDTEGFRVAARRTMALAAQFNSASHMIEEINLGGGFGIAYTIQDTPMSPAELNRGLVQAIDEARSQYNLAPVKLSIEPGRAICGPACVALYTVGTIKKVDIGDGKTRTYVAVDGGMSDNIRTALYQAEYSAVLANRSSDAEPMLSRVVGKHCESGDILVHDVYLPSDLRIGDIIAVPASGAYTRSMASNYNYALRPAMVAVNSKGSRLILRRETLEDLLALDVGEDDKTLG
jgi:diaminopimelate decarboxylase